MKNINLILTVMSTVALTACGSTSMRESSAVVAGSSTTTGSGTGLGSGTGGTGGNTYNLPAASQQRIELGGNSSVDFQKTLTFMTSRTLKVKIKPLPAPNIVVPGYTNWVFPYGCMSVSVTVNGMTRGTQVLKVEGVAQGQTTQCANATTSKVLDFTDFMTGTGSTVVVISNANYDNCRYYWPLNYGCGMSAVWQNHRVAMDSTVQVDGTWMDP